MPDAPWANGAGSTRLLWSDPPGDRRVSVAMLERPATFSVLPGTARLLVVLDQIVIDLDIRGEPKTLHRHDMIAFAGDDPVALIALDRPGRVLNLIARADRWIPSIDGAAPIGRVALNDGNAVCSGDFILGPYPLLHAIAVGFRKVDPVAKIG